METKWSWVQPLHSTVASSELRDIYEVYNREREREIAQMDVAQLVRLPNKDQMVMGSTPTFHSGI